MTKFDYIGYLKELAEQRREGFFDDEDLCRTVNEIGEGMSIGEFNNFLDQYPHFAKYFEFKKDADIIIIRPIREGDIQELFKFHNLFYRELFERPQQETEQKLPNLVSLIAEIEGKIIGLAEYTLEPTDPFGESKVYCGCAYLDKLIIDPRFRRKKTGSLLVHQVVKDTYENSCLHKLVLYSPEKSCEFYEKNGFLTDGTIAEKENLKFTKFILPFFPKEYSFLRGINIDDKLLEEDKPRFQDNIVFDILRTNLPDPRKFKIEY